MSGEINVINCTLPICGHFMVVMLFTTQFYSSAPESLWIRRYSYLTSLLNKIFLCARVPRQRSR